MLANALCNSEVILLLTGPTSKTERLEDIIGP